MRGLGATTFLMIALVVAPGAASGYSHEIPLKEKSANRTAERFLELFAIKPYTKGQADCSERLRSSRRFCDLQWSPGDTSGTATITAFISKKNSMRSAAIKFVLIRRFEDCTDQGLGPGPCRARTSGTIVFRLSSAQ